MSEERTPTPPQDWAQEMRDSAKQRNQTGDAIKRQLDPLSVLNDPGGQQGAQQAKKDAMLGASMPEPQKESAFVGPKRVKVPSGGLTTTVGGDAAKSLQDPTKQDMKPKPESGGSTDRINTAEYSNMPVGGENQGEGGMPPDIQPHQKL